MRVFDDVFLRLEDWKEGKKQRMKCDVSVVVPLYNTRNFVKFTVDSILNQTLANIEVLIVDDCSADGSLEYCRELYGHDSRVKILPQPKNIGPGAARNRGIRESQGEYIAFIDSDDEILPDMLSKMFSVAKKYNADVVQDTKYFLPSLNKEGNFPLQMLDDDVMLLPTSSNANGEDYSELTRLSDDLDSRFEDWKKRLIPWSVFTKIFRRAFLTDNEIFFSDVNIFAEDMLFCFECLFKAKNYVMVPEANCVYRITPTSASRGKAYSAKILKALRSQREAVRNMTRICSGIPFFANDPRKAVSALEIVVNDLELGFIRPAYQKLGEETLRSDKLFHDFMREEFGDKAPYVEFLFFELHNHYEPIVDYVGMLGDIEYWRSLVKEYREKQEGKK